MYDGIKLNTSNNLAMIVLKWRLHTEAQGDFFVDICVSFTVYFGVNTDNKNHFKRAPCAVH